MALTKSTNTYATAAEYTEYAALFGYDALSDAEPLLARATAYIDILYRFSGYKTSADQPLEWPRNGSVDIPKRVTQATCEMARLLDLAVDPTSQPEPAIKSESTDVAGAISESRTYDTAHQVDNFYSVSLLLGPLAGAGSFQIPLVRG